MNPHARRILFASAALLLSASPAYAQFVPGTPYQLTRGPNTYVELPNPTVLSTNIDDGQFAVTLPFSILFYDTMESSVSVGANGAIAFPSGTFVSLGNTAPGTASSPAGFVAPLWDDLRLYSATNALIGWEVQGTAPSRTATVEWRNISFFGAQGVTFSMQVRFYEGASGRIDIDYGPLTGTDSITATMGMEDTMNARPILFAPSMCTTNCTLMDYMPNTRVTVVQDPGIELAAVSVDAPALGFLGAQTLVPVTVRNLHGNPIGPFDVEVVASQSQDLTNAITIGTATMNLAAFQLQTINVTTVPPASLGEGTVFLGLNVDSGGVINEVNENNNTIASATPIRLVQGLADVAVQRVRTSVAQIAAGGTLDVFTTVQNVGGEPANNVTVAVMLSSNPVISPQDVELATFNVSLQPGESVTTTTAVTIDGATNSGAYYVGGLADPGQTLDELSEANNGLADINTLAIAGGALSILTNNLPLAYVGVSYGARLTAAGGDPADQRWEVTQGQMPTGLGITPATGELFGRPTAAEMQTFTVQVTSGGETATKELTLTVSDPAEPLTIVTRAIPRGVVGQEYAFPMVVTGGAQTSSLSWSATNLPMGFMLTEAGVLAGTPEMASSSTITVSVTDGTESASRDLLLEIRENSNLLITPRLLSTARFGEAYSEQLASTGGTPPIVWLIDSGSMPPGLTLSTEGAISGSPDQAGVYSFVVEARDSTVGQPARDANTFVIEVLDDGTLTITTERLEDAIVNTGYEAALEAMGGLPPYTWQIAEGTLPEGLVGSENLETGAFQIRGQVAAPGTSNFLVEVRDAQGRFAQRAFSLRIVTAPPVIDNGEEDGGCSCRTESRTTRSWAFLLLLVPLFLRRRN